MTPEDQAALRRPFDPKTVGTLPKPYRADSPKGNCGQCGGYHGLPAAHLSFVGHAAVTDRLLAVDPAWTWEPVAFDAAGLPAFDAKGGLWIRLTVLGVTRLGYGDGPDPKQRIGDAIRNAAMRFGVALDLWSQQELEGTDPNGGDALSRDEPARAGGAPPPAGPGVTDAEWLAAWRPRVTGTASRDVLRALWTEMTAAHAEGRLSAEDRTDCAELLKEVAADIDAAEAVDTGAGA